MVQTASPNEDLRELILCVPLHADWIGFIWKILAQTHKKRGTHRLTQRIQTHMQVQST